jgi:hypothetical protein
LVKIILLPKEVTRAIYYEFEKPLKEYLYCFKSTYYRPNRKWLSGYKHQEAHHILKNKIQLIILSDDLLQLHNIWMVQFAE